MAFKKLIKARRLAIARAITRLASLLDFPKNVFVRASATRYLATPPITRLT